MLDTSFIQLYFPFIDISILEIHNH